VEESPAANDLLFIIDVFLLLSSTLLNYTRSLIDVEVRADGRVLSASLLVRSSQVRNYRHVTLTEYSPQPHAYVQPHDISSTPRRGSKMARRPLRVSSPRSEIDRASCTVLLVCRLDRRARRKVKADCKVRLRLDAARCWHILFTRSLCADTSCRKRFSNGMLDVGYLPDSLVTIPRSLDVK
jgi:hypothetical protein